MKYCSKCGAQLPDESRFCDTCGTPVESVAEPAAAPEEQYDGPRVTLCADGKYHWTYHLNMLKNPMVFLTICKIFGIIGGLAFLISMITTVKDSGWGAFADSLKYWGIGVLVFLVLAGVSYLIWAAIYGGKYVVRFTMDEKGLVHDQIPEQAKKARVLGGVLAGTGVLTGNATRAGQGMAVASHTSLASDFSKVKSIKPYARWNTIKVNEPLSKNQVYICEEDFDFVLNYLHEHCPKVK